MIFQFILHILHNQSSWKSIIKQASNQSIKLTMSTEWFFFSVFVFLLESKISQTSFSVKYVVTSLCITFSRLTCCRLDDLGFILNSCTRDFFSHLCSETWVCLTSVPVDCWNKNKEHNADLLPPCSTQLSLCGAITSCSL